MSNPIIATILIIHLNIILGKETTDVFYNLTDFTIKNKKIGNILSFRKDVETVNVFDNAILMDPNKLFKLKNNGDFYTKVEIDRDKVCVKYSCCKDYICTISLKAHLFKISPISFNIIIKIFDENDNNPKFSTLSSTLSIPESADLNSTFKLPVAVDIDSTLFGIDSYKLLDSTNTFQNIMINNEPYLKLYKSLDREKLDNYNMQLLVFDKSSPSLTSTLNLIVKITDVNDNAPYFVEYLDNGNFRILNSTGTYKIDHKENQLSSLNIYNFYAKDDDEAENSKITYSISPTLSNPSTTVQQKFSLESPHNSAAIKLRLGLDYETETERSILLVIIAKDNGIPSKSASISLTVNLIDVNDNPPVITESDYKDISENDGEKHKLKLFIVSDKDRLSDKKIQCALHDMISSKFQLERYDWNVYGLFNKIQFDYEIRKTEMVRIICIDKAEPTMTQTTDFFVNIIDKNDNVPQWEQIEYKLQMFENANPGEIVINVTAKDADGTRFKKFHYNISNEVNDKKLNVIQIDSLTGSIRMTKAVDREKYPQLIYFITVTDNFDNNEDLATKIIHHSNTTKLTIEILDENDNNPIFDSKIKHFKISEDSSINTKFGKLHFSDLDESPNNIITISLLDHETLSQKTNYWFGIIDNDTIMVKNPLDREDMGNITLIVQAVDGGYPQKTGTETIFIEILDVNDNYPILNNLQNNTFISGGGTVQSTAWDTKIIQLDATDRDNGLNGTISYKLVYTNLTNQKDIKINEETGYISTNWKGSDTPEIGVYYIFLAISDKGNPPLTIHIMLYINITSTSTNQLTEAYMSNIVILILIIVCSLALIVSLIAAIFWVRFRVTNESPVACQEEYFEREHLNKEVNSHQYSLMNLDKTFRQNSYENNRLNAYETYQGFHHDSYIQNRNHTNYSNNTLHDVLDKSRMTPCEDCLTVYGTVPAQCNRFETSLSRLRHPIIPDLNSTYSGNIISSTPKNYILQSYCENDYKTVANIQPPTLMVEPNFSDSGKGGSVEDLNYRQFTGISTFTNSSFVNTSSANAKIFCQNSNIDTNVNQCLYDKSSETMF